MGEYSGWKPCSDWGGGHGGGGPLEDLAGYHPGSGAMVSMGYDDTEYGGPQQYTPYTGYGPSMAQTNYPHGPHDEPDMGWEGRGFGGGGRWGGGGGQRGPLRGMWKDRRGLLGRIFNRAMPPAAPVIAPPPPDGYPAPPPPDVAPPAADMGWEWHDDQPAPPPPDGQWGGGMALDPGIARPDWRGWQGRGGRGYGRRW
jgi:hypothetical protein